MSQWIGAYGSGMGGDMWQGLGSCGRVRGHMAGGGGMWQGVGSCGRVWGHVADGGGIW